MSKVSRYMGHLDFFTPRIVKIQIDWACTDNRCRCKCIIHRTELGQHAVAHFINADNVTCDDFGNSRWLHRLTHKVCMKRNAPRIGDGLGNDIRKHHIRHLGFGRNESNQGGDRLNMPLSTSA